MSGHSDGGYDGGYKPRGGGYIGKNFDPNKSRGGFRQTLNAFDNRGRSNDGGFHNRNYPDRSDGRRNNVRGSYQDHRDRSKTESSQNIATFANDGPHSERPYFSNRRPRL